MGWIPIPASHFLLYSHNSLLFNWINVCFHKSLLPNDLTKKKKNCQNLKLSDKRSNDVSSQIILSQQSLSLNENIYVFNQHTHFYLLAKSYLPFYRMWKWKNQLNPVTGLCKNKVITVITTTLKGGVLSYSYS